MTNPNSRDSFKLDMSDLTERLTKLVHEGKVRKIIVRREDETIAEFPLAAGVVAFAIAAPLAAIGAIAALVTNCTIEVERTDTESESPGPNE